MVLPLRPDIACFYEGTSEKAILDMLIDSELLIFERNDLVDETFLSMQELSKKNIDNFSQRILRQVDSEEKIDIIIVQDRFIVPKFSESYDDKIGNIYIVLTKPEIEMLMIQEKGWYNEFQKVKSSTKPKTFVAQKLKKKSAEITSYKFIQKYFTPASLKLSILELAHVSKKAKNSYLLSDIVKQKNENQPN